MRDGGKQQKVEGGGEGVEGEGSMQAGEGGRDETDGWRVEEGCREARGGRRGEFKERMKGGRMETGMEGREKRN